MNWRTSCVFCLFSIILLLTTSCSSLNFIASGKTPFIISATSKSEQINTIEGSREFYFWGLSPLYIDVELEDQINPLGLSFPSFVSVEQTTSWKSILYSVLTLGLYCPVDYAIVVHTAREDL